VGPPPPDPPDPPLLYWLAGGVLVSVVAAAELIGGPPGGDLANKASRSCTNETMQCTAQLSVSSVDGESDYLIIGAGRAVVENQGTNRCVLQVLSMS
jgi:hypothetical protein